jgi:YD repeat-containing protein
MAIGQKLLATCSAAALIFAGSSAALAGSTAYKYDALGRVTRATDADGTVITYGYDPAGNRTVKSIVNGTNHAPVASADSVSTLANTALDFDPRANDTDADSDPLTITSVGPPSHGAVTISPTATILHYVPTTSYAGTDSFTYTVSDGRGGTASATVSMTVSTSNHAPVANSDSITTALNTAKTFDPRTNDTDADGNALTITGVTNGAHGTATSTGSSVTFTPTTGYSGSDSFSYTISDSQPGGTATGSVTVSITSGNQPPLAVYDSIYFTTSGGGTVTYDAYVLSNDSDPDGDTLTITSVSTPDNGAAASIVSNHIHLTSLHLGVTTFTYTISDGHGNTATASVEIDRERPGGACGGAGQPACP